jgi:hypothetical protein
MAVKNIFDLTRPSYLDVLEGDVHYGPDRVFASQLPTIKQPRKGLGSLFSGSAQAAEMGEEEDLMSAVLRMKMISGLLNLGEPVPDNDDELIMKYIELIGDPR